MKRRILVIGYGNPGRLDDGLGPAFAERLDAMSLPNVTVDSNYQLTVEDAEEVAGHDLVIFADASLECDSPFSIREIEPDETANFSSHILEPENVLALAKRLFNAGTRGYILGIRGYEFNGFGERLSERAEENLMSALEYIKGIITGDSFDEIPRSNSNASMAEKLHTNGDE